MRLVAGLDVDHVELAHHLLPGGPTGREEVVEHAASPPAVGQQTARCQGADVDDSDQRARHDTRADEVRRGGHTEGEHLGHACTVVHARILASSTAAAARQGVDEPEGHERDGHGGDNEMPRAQPALPMGKDWEDGDDHELSDPQEHE